MNSWIRSNNCPAGSDSRYFFSIYEQTLSLKLEPLLTPPRYCCLSHHLFSPNNYPFTPVGDTVSNLVSFSIKSLQCLLRSLLSLAPVYAATGTELFLALIYAGLVKPRLLHATTVVLNHKIFFISC